MRSTFTHRQKDTKRECRQKKKTITEKIHIADISSLFLVLDRSAAKNVLVLQIHQIAHPSHKLTLLRLWHIFNVLVQISSPSGLTQTETFEILGLVKGVGVGGGVALGVFG